MTGPGRVLVPLFCIAFTALGIALIAVGEPMVGGAAVLCFGVGGLALLPAARRRRRPQAARSIVFDGEPALLFPLGQGRQALAGVGAAGMAAASLLLVVGGALLGVIGLVFFGPVSALLLTRINRPHGLVLTPTRVVQDTLYHVEIPWDAIEGVGLMSMASTTMLAVQAGDRSRVRAGWFSRLNRRFSPADIAIPTIQMAGPPEEALRTLQLCLVEPEARARLGTT